MPQFSYIPISLVVPPSLYLVHHQLNLIYQFWLHTEAIGKVGPLEWILNTPSHHRVHHGTLNIPHDLIQLEKKIRFQMNHDPRNRMQQVLPGQKLWRLVDHLGSHVRHLPGRAAR